ncbi:MAG TPA: trypsin-like peptidase domain-containing protein, partial [Acidimicrobiia bacterium]|nr:trypsin-like peptidase domain-containing protein [Acidimicrobiia bacterium]
MTDETNDEVPVTEPPAHGQAVNDPPVTDPPRPYPGGTDPGWASPPAWGHAPRESAPWGFTPPAATPPTSEPPASPPYAAAGSGGGGWNYGYGGLWTPPPEPPARPPNSTRRAIAALAIAVLVLVSASIGAVISAAVHNNTSSPPAASPFTGGTSQNPFGSNSVIPDNTGSDSGAIAAKVSPALVNIYTTIDTGSGSGQAAGTGMVISSSGEVLTNNHVIADASTVRVELVSTGATHTAKVLGYDVKDDVALLQIDNVSNL